MPRITVGLGGILILLGIIAYAATSFASVTALIPAFLGLVLLVSGLIGFKNAKIGIHIALVVALLGAIGTSMNVMQLGALFAGDAERPAAVIVSTVTFVLLIVYIVVGVRSFIRARRWKNTEA
ncbi:hypothetical protein [Nesterenkonia xinjiangensis]|uniref:Uncharacterized protein n=1 Tax=Nesterenkonia xinjiangensis TaxID=225327 RepID=A0A7Z0GPI5_9MICC|nr:hypothetical protein [Nesterenkonia xinjiangensis]NYJ78718.1 hypothetical protein [Nesterenkonia xinjiangensis]